MEDTPLVRRPLTMADTKGIGTPRQAEHPALMIPGPVEFDDEVLEAMGHYRSGILAAVPLAIH